MNDKVDKATELRCVFLSLGSNIEGDVLIDGAQDPLQFDEAVWRRITGHAKERGFNAVLIDLCDGCTYPSHPELAVKGSWSVQKMRGELMRLRKMGLEPIPKLNFSTTHDAWLKEYGRMVSTPEYYKVCSDLIHDVYEIFDHPRLFHFGFDEESAHNQRKCMYCVLRQGELWWHDFMFFVNTIEKLGMRLWIWSDYVWEHRDEFLSRMPKSVMQSNWYYRQWFDFKTIPKERRTHLESFLVLEKHGFDQIPCGSNWACEENISGLVRFCRKHIAPERLKGFLMATWDATIPSNESKLLRGIDLASSALNMA